jgi:heterodisulfide reductase subunit D
MILQDALRETHATLCQDCGKCTGICPVSRYDDEFSPRMIVTHAVHAPEGQTPSKFNLCLTCMLCSLVCPSEVYYSQFTRKGRQVLRSEGAEPACSHGAVFQNMMRIMGQDGKKQNRLGWVPEEAKTKTEGDLLYFTGCMPYYDAYYTHLETDTQRIGRDTLRVLNGLGEEPVLLPDELCCGHDLYWSGDEEGAAKLAKKNVARIASSGAKTVVSSCPECVYMLRVVYPKLAGDVPYEALHLTEYIEQKRASGELELQGLEGEITFHDPCRLSRHLDQPDAPRGALTEIFGESFHEMEHHGKTSVCCGTSGWMHCNSVSKQIQIERLREAVDSGAETMVTACPKCQIHFRCAQAGDKDDKLKSLRIRDYATVLAESIDGGKGSW